MTIQQALELIFERFDFGEDVIKDADGWEHAGSKHLKRVYFEDADPALLVVRTTGNLL
jgi:hypothetical protein